MILKKQKGYIYAITNSVNDKRLVGQTNNLQRRIKEHFTILKQGRHDNPHIQYAFNKYGEEKFRYELLHEAVVTQEELDRLEEEFRLKYYPNVYNIRTGGHGGCKFDDAAKKRMSVAQNKLGKITNWAKQREASNARWAKPGSKIWRLEKTKELMSDPAMKKRMTSGIRAITSEQRSNWGKANWKSNEYRKKVTDAIIATWKNPDLVNGRSKFYGNVRSPTGEILEVFNLRKFCRDHDLDRANFCRMLHGKSRQSKGWTKI